MLICTHGIFGTLVADSEHIMNVVLKFVAPP